MDVEQIALLRLELFDIYQEYGYNLDHRDTKYHTGQRMGQQLFKKCRELAKLLNIELINEYGKRKGWKQLRRELIEYFEYDFFAMG
jgi:hypothetical protein